MEKQKNAAYIDAANLHKGVKSAGWLLDYKRFRVWLREKYSVEHAYLFIGLVPKYKEGNCDAELVLTAAKDFYESDYSKVVLVYSDGDYACLVKFLLERNKFRVLLSPYNYCSILLKRTSATISYLNDKKKIIGIN